MNAGGVVYLDFASEPGAPAAITARVDAIGDTVTTIFSDARAQGITTLEVAERLAIARLDAGS